MRKTQLSKQHFSHISNNKNVVLKEKNIAVFEAIINTDLMDCKFIHSYN